MWKPSRFLPILCSQNIASQICHSFCHGKMTYNFSGVPGGWGGGGQESSGYKFKVSIACKQACLFGILREYLGTLCEVSSRHFICIRFNKPIGAKKNVNKHDSKLHMDIFAADSKISSWLARKLWWKPWFEQMIVAVCGNVLLMLSIELENLVVCPQKILYRASNREGSHGDVLASMCENIGVTFMKSPSLSEHVCHPCTRKIRNLHKTSYLLRYKTQPAKMKQSWKITAMPPEANANCRLLFWCQIKVLPTGKCQEQIVEKFHLPVSLYFQKHKNNMNRMNL